MDLNKLTKPERAVWQAFPRGELVDLGGAHGAGRIVRADVISALLLGAVPAEPGRVAAVRLSGARVTGALDLGHAVIVGAARLRGCEFDCGIDLSGARTRDFDLDGSRLAGLAAPLAEIDGNLSLVGGQCSGQVTLTGAHITGALQMQRSLLDTPGGVALLANRLVIDDDLLGQQATVNGEMRLAGAQVGGIIGLAEAVIHGGGRRAINAYNLSVGLSLVARFGFTAEGEVALSDARIGQSGSCANSHRHVS